MGNISPHILLKCTQFVSVWSSQKGWFPCFRLSHSKKSIHKATQLVSKTFFDPVAARFSQPGGIPRGCHPGHLRWKAGRGEGGTIGRFRRRKNPRHRRGYVSGFRDMPKNRFDLPQISGFPIVRFDLKKWCFPLKLSRQGTLTKTHTHTNTHTHTDACLKVGNLKMDGGPLSFLQIPTKKWGSNSGIAFLVSRETNLKMEPLGLVI